MLVLLLTTFALFSLCHCAPIKDATHSVDPVGKLPIEAINEFWALGIDNTILGEQKFNVLKQWMAKWSLTTDDGMVNNLRKEAMADSTMNHIKPVEEPAISNIVVQVLATERANASIARIAEFVNVVTAWYMDLNSKNSAKLNAITEKISKFELHMIIRF
ncbi:hypothetical protein PFISCL1PPCAC_25773, partial [Pristionchus fissidentatus]